ncbi:MAG: serine/threonine-protein kinase [Cytophagaceae bacterium]|nr:serine/threonine-protein kinase [Gemmatimonadaceae bacterium]
MTDAPLRLTSALAGRYRVDRELGQGGMATVYLAHDEKHNRRVAIKVLHPELSAVLGTERFLREIELTANLQHPNILPLFDSGVADGLLYYVMPFVEGETLRARLDREHQLPIADALRIARDVADALEYAHKRGVIHRDIKPENVLLHEGRPQVADFGIALAVQEAGGQRMTQTGLSLGTPQYMAPEQAMGEKTVDARADIFALGAVTYEMLAGEPPFTGPTMQAVLAKVLTAHPAALTDVRKSVPGHVAVAVAVALEKLPADRHASAAAFSRALAEGQLHSTLPSPPPTRGLALVSGAMPGLAGLLAGALLGIGAVTWLRSPREDLRQPPFRFVFNPPDSIELQAVCCGQMMDLSPDGRLLVYQGRRRVADSATTRPDYGLYLHNLSDLSTRRIPGSEGAASLSFSPDGRQLAFVSNQRLMRVAVAGGEPVSVATLPNGYVGGTTWGSNERIISAIGMTLHEVNTTTGEQRVLLANQTAGLQVTGPSWVREGQAVLFSYATLEESPEVYWLPSGSTTPRRLTQGATPRYVPAWRALVIARSGGLVVYPFNPTTGDTTGPGVQVPSNFAMRSPVVAHGEYAVSVNGALVMIRRDAGPQGSSVTIVGTKGDSVVHFPPQERQVLDHVSFSPDGKRFALDARATTNGIMTRSVFTWDIARGVAARVTSDSRARMPVWTADGDSVVFQAGPTGTFMIQAADGSGRARALFDLKGWGGVLTHAIHGPWVVVAGTPSTNASNTDIGVANRDSGAVVRPYLNTDADERAPAISPDGAWLAYTSDVSGVAEVYISPFPVPTARYAVSSGGGQQPVWSGDGRTLYFIGERQFIAVPFTPGTPPVMGASRVIDRREPVRVWTISPDGKVRIFINTVRLAELHGMEVVLNLRPLP